MTSRDLRPLMKSNGGTRGPKSVSIAETSDSPWIPCSSALPEKEPGYETSLGHVIKNADRGGYGYWHLGKGVWVDEFGVPIGWEPTEWKR